MSPPTDIAVQPISEVQLAALVHGFEAHETEAGTVYRKPDQPWLFTRRDPYLIVTHRSAPYPPHYYEIV